MIEIKISKPPKPDYNCVQACENPAIVRIKIFGDWYYFCKDCAESIQTQLNSFMAEMNKADKLPEDEDGEEPAQERYCETCSQFGMCQLFRNGAEEMPCHNYDYCGLGENYEGVTE
jgi:hypothetical protein